MQVPPCDVIVGDTTGYEPRTLRAPDAWQPVEAFGKRQLPTTPQMEPCDALRTGACRSIPPHSAAGTRNCRMVAANRVAPLLRAEYCGSARPIASRAATHVAGDPRVARGVLQVAAQIQGARKSRIAAAISGACVSSAKCPVSKKLTTASGISRLNASAPGGRKNGSFLPHTARSGGLYLRK